MQPPCRGDNWWEIKLAYARPDLVTAIGWVYERTVMMFKGTYPDGVSAAIADGRSVVTVGGRGNVRSTPKCDHRASRWHELGAIGAARTIRAECRTRVRPMCAAHVVCWTGDRARHRD